MSALGRRTLGVGVGLLLDRACGEPPDAWHPVAWFGAAMGHLERVRYADTRAAGIGYALAGAGLGAGAGVVLTGAPRLFGRRDAERQQRSHAGRAAPVGALALAVGVASAGRMLRETSAEIEQRLLAGDLEGARVTLPWLVGRDPSGLDSSDMSAAVVESLAENTVDAVIAPACWGLVAGAPGVLVHRAVNTMDAMVGHHSERYERFGWASARLDDVMAWAPARVFAALVALDAWTRGAVGRGIGSPGQVLRAVRRDAPAHPSPNSGVAEAAVASALGIELGGPLRYGERSEDRPRLGQGPRPLPTDITTARRLVDRVELTVAAACVALWWSDRRREQRHTRRSAR
ncbi:MAG: CobD/CbiB family cobalamin biosynthesis protein [Ornithinimicrobium sp.]|uniref:CobD/CbiB family cobalamin biosynthesis protein n=1 Tax=Ornithinimicrobium sp. TaxID=1977084 RepID=UPI0026E096FC|nr:CobD/CbiB family cobalamin biosynthesis protein [Ornithinimicrobium sp.]MDO5740296.1 CobD/CbiB family cobalamin biosynthesis protein [Ornithinimicrobium sp.]